MGSTSNGYGDTPSKRPKLGTDPEFTINPAVAGKLGVLKQAWKDGKELSDGKLKFHRILLVKLMRKCGSLIDYPTLLFTGSSRISHTPFQHCELNQFIDELKALDSFIETAYDPDEVEFVDKSSDLFQFKQSLDLNTVDFPGLESMRSFFKDAVYPFVKELTGLPLNGQVDLF